MQQVPARDWAVHAEVSIVRIHLIVLPCAATPARQLCPAVLVIDYRPYTLCLQRNRRLQADCDPVDSTHHDVNMPRMKLFRKLHGRLVPPGAEIRILRKLPKVTLIGSLIPLALAILVRVLPPQPGVDMAKHIKTVDIYAIALEVTFLTAMFTVAIGAVVVHIMKGPAYVADAYPVSHADRPKRDDEPEQ